MCAKGLSALTIAGLLVGIAAPAWSQSLADVAKKEEERRKQTAAPKKVYTNKDLAHVPGDAPAVPADPANESKDAKDANADKAADKGPAKDQTFWSKRMKALRETVDRDSTLADAVQSRINALTTDFVNRDDPAQRSVIERDRARALAELERLKKQIVEDQKAITDAEEEARRAGVPAGWVR